MFLFLFHKLLCEMFVPFDLDSVLYVNVNTRYEGIQKINDRWESSGRAAQGWRLQRRGRARI